MGSCLSVTRASPVVGRCEESATPTTSSKHDYSMEMRLHRVAGRIFLNGSSQVASLFCKQGRKGVNQDAMLLWENFCNKEGTVFCGVFDGHGPHGHTVAKKVRDSFPLKLIAQWNLHPNNNAHTLVDTSNFAKLRESFLKACKVMDKELKLHHHIDCYCSGTTAVTLLKQGHDLVIANIGDSRAVLGTLDLQGSLIAVQLTTDLKPNLPREAERIRICKGRVFALENEPRIARVWLPNVDSPGLAMARAFGDFCLKDFGVISVPDVSYHRLTEEDQFVVLATDGVWDVLSNQEVVSIVASTPRYCAARILVESAVQAWRTKMPTSKADDCSVVCLFFDSDSHPKNNSEVTNECSRIGTRAVVEQSPLLEQKQQ
ncbi:probable protein phosphatase 2C 33 [Abrus precatorius]|uniref:Probable protein phosphatase 2C 33 n=1 Tax=Abrus precatorius TaxID=3816 RepID=A0A8B8M4R9_ABRPR|nr:probable protein phosphatase 2C 33 [Abrus precatorius]